MIRVQINISCHEKVRLTSSFLLKHALCEKATVKKKKKKKKLETFLIQDKTRTDTEV